MDFEDILHKLKELKTVEEQFQNIRYVANQFGIFLSKNYDYVDDGPFKWKDKLTDSSYNFSSIFKLFIEDFETNNN